LQEDSSDEASPKKQSTITEELPLFDGISVWGEDLDGQYICSSVPFTIGETLPATESEAYRRAWALELHAALSYN